MYMHSISWQTRQNFNKKMTNGIKCSRFELGKINLQVCYENVKAISVLQSGNTNKVATVSTAHFVNISKAFRNTPCY
jgi:hypothetical protein